MTVVEQDMRTFFSASLVALGRAHPAMVVLDDDLSTSTGTHQFAAEFPDRFIQCGIAEQNMMGVAAGIATSRHLVPLAVTFGVFASRRTYDQITVSIAYPRLNVKIIGTSSGLTSAPGGASHQSLEDLALMRALPGMTVIDPADNAELLSVLETMVPIFDGPVYIRTMRCVPRRVTPAGYRFQRGKALVLRDGYDVTLIGTGYMTAIVVDAAEHLAKEGVSARVIHNPCLKPMDVEILIQAADETGAIVTAENHSIIGGLGSAVAEVLGEYAPVPLARVGTPDVFGETGPMDALFAKYGLTVDDVVRAARRVLVRKAGRVRA